ncbi:UNVERIFIED_CONTAM: hypothetical protein FKN15_009263 [Acipenser sinensis]
MQIKSLSAAGYPRTPITQQMTAAEVPVLPICRASPRADPMAQRSGQVVKSSGIKLSCLLLQ